MTQRKTRLVEQMMERLYVLPSGEDDGLTDLYLYWHYRGKPSHGWVLHLVMTPRTTGRAVKFDVVPLEFSYVMMRNHAPYNQRSARLSVFDRTVSMSDNPPFDPLDELDKHIAEKMLARIIERARSGGLRGHDTSTKVSMQTHATMPNPRRR